MDAIKVEPDSDGETPESHGNDQENDSQEDKLPQPFAFAAVKVEVEVRGTELLNLNVTHWLSNALDITITFLLFTYNHID
jgi:hypothetical protein